MSFVDYLQSLNIRAINERLTALIAQVNRMDTRMSQLRDYVDAVNAETTSIGDDVKKVADQLASAINSGDPQALADMGNAVSALKTAGDALHALATGSGTDPVPPPVEGPTPPADSTPAADSHPTS
jgi:uncharacterized protein (UPF0335 family)